MKNFTRRIIYTTAVIIGILLGVKFIQVYLPGQHDYNREDTFRYALYAEAYEALLKDLTDDLERFGIHTVVYGPVIVKDIPLPATFQNMLVWANQCDTLFTIAGRTKAVKFNNIHADGAVVDRYVK